MNGVPPGRAGRLRLERRLQVARRGADLLDRKLRILQRELPGLRADAQRAAREWERCAAEADRWLLRAAVLGGQRAIRLAGSPIPADVEVGYAVTVGVRHPAAVTCTFPRQDSWAGATLAGAGQAHQASLEAAARSAAASAAVRIMEAETAATRQRLRAVRDRWIPRLERARDELALAIDEQERADGARLRLAMGKNRR
ncbi:MAG TPA: V-type ATP synthase subunit D [Streptosporangiaceae bacterium]|nr:V-type ATP synthase subunit D [Streptosporangiaceae bacterium]